jgi:ADP-dependent NAD(P)H-hydrate dehydratase
MSADWVPITTLPALPVRPTAGHKGTFGRALIVAGSRGMSGAACLAGTAALRGGAGLVTVAVPESLLPIVARYEPSYLTLPLAEAEGRIDAAAIPESLRVMGTQTAVAIGPGLGRSAALDELVVRVYWELSVPAVIDADGLNALAAVPQRWNGVVPPAARIFTPHYGEFARLTGQPIQSLVADRTAAAVTFARTHGVTLVLKGPGTLITDGSRVAENTTGNSGMATGGTGDVLTGILVALLAQGMPAFEAAQLGVFLHGLAGDLAAAELSQPGLIASDMLPQIGHAWRRLGR